MIFTKKFQMLFLDMYGNKYSLVGKQDDSGWWDFQVHNKWNPDGSLNCIDNFFDDLPLIGELDEVIDNIKTKYGSKHRFERTYTILDAKPGLGV